MTVISDTTPVISLIKISRLDLLEKLFGEVLVPETVLRELTTNTAFKKEAEIVQSSSFIKPHQSKIENHLKYCELQVAWTMEKARLLF